MARILLVDDDKDLLSIMSEYLSACGFELELAYSAAQARHYLEHSECDAILSDFNMPGESGLDLLSHVSSRYPGLPFIMMTGSSTSLLEDKAMKMGSSRYIVKPFRLRDLVRTLETIPGFSNREAQALALTHSAGLGNQTGV
jgi:DNA-binding NtrC family response regulator